jgi:hypothetical protein
MVSMHPLIRDHKTIPVGLLRCLRSLPNLHTLRLFHLEYRLRLSLEFYSSIPPQVRTIAIAQHVIQPHIIVSFRWWAQIASYEGMNTGRDVENLLDDSEKTLEELDGFALDDAAVDCPFFLYLSSMSCKPYCSYVRQISSKPHLISERYHSPVGSQLFENLSAPINRTLMSVCLGDSCAPPFTH